MNESLTRFLHTFNRISNKHAPIKSIKIKGKSNKPWKTKGLKKLIKVRNQLYKNWLTTCDSNYYNRYKMYRNKIVTINKLYRTIYYDSILKESTNSKKMWDNINLIINKKWPSSTIDNLQVNGKTLHQLGCNTQRHFGQEHTLLYYATQSVVRTLTSGSRAHPNISLPFFFFEATT